MERRSLTLSPPELAPDRLGFFRWGRVAGRVLLTNDAGEWAYLTEAEFADLLAARIADGHPRFEELRAKGCLRDGLELDALAAKVARRNRHVGRGAHLHVVTLTLRCDQDCAYCRALRHGDAADVDMSLETAGKVVDLALQSTSPSITFELQAQGGEPLHNFDVLRHFVEVARTGGRKAGKALTFNLLSNFLGMTEERAEWLIENDIRMFTTLDGPARVHDANRKWKHGSAHAEVVRWIEYFNRRYAETQRDPQLWRIDALLTATRQTLEAWREVVDEYVARGMRVIHLRPLGSIGFTPDTWRTIGYSVEEYLDFYRPALDYILELSRNGTEIVERTASILAMKILTSDDPAIVDIQSPCGAGTGEIAYNVDGCVFPCDDARLIEARGDPIFALGHVSELSIADVVRHPTVRAIAAASLLDSQPMCADCWNKPFCGFSPVRVYATQGDLFGQRHACFQCKEQMGVSTKLFEQLADENDSEMAEVVKRWVAAYPRVADERGSREAP